MNIKHYKTRLLELEKSLSARTGRALAEGGAHFIDSAHDTGDSSVADIAASDHFAEAERDADMLNQVRDALDRIEKGSYGKCLVDGRPIEAKRLEAVPWSAYCLEHEGMIEADARSRK